MLATTAVTPTQKAWAWWGVKELRSPVFNVNFSEPVPIKKKKKFHVIWLKPISNHPLIIYLPPVDNCNTNVLVSLEKQEINY